MNKKKGQVLITVLNLNGWQETISCIEAVLAQTYQDFHVLLIDNGSADESLEKLAHFENNEKITFHKEPVNLGFAGGVNIGIKTAIKHSYPYICLLNNDAILSKDWVTVLINRFDDTSASAIGGLLLSGNGRTIDSSGDSFTIWGLPFPRQRNEPADNAFESDYVFGTTAGASIYKTALFKDIGQFDETFFAYFEDTDISFRTQLAGHKVYYDKSAIAYHERGVTSSKLPGFTVFQSFKNLPIYFLKNVPNQLLLTIGLRFIALYALMYIRAIIRGQIIVATKGIVKSIALIPHALRERRKIQQNRSVSIEYLKSVIYDDMPPSNKRYIQKQLRKFKL